MSRFIEEGKGENIILSDDRSSITILPRDDEGGDFDWCRIYLNGVLFVGHSIGLITKNPNIKIGLTNQSPYCRQSERANYEIVATINTAPEVIKNISFAIDDYGREEPDTLVFEGNRREHICMMLSYGVDMSRIGAVGLWPVLWFGNNVPDGGATIKPSSLFTKCAELIRTTIGFDPVGGKVGQLPIPETVRQKLLNYVVFKRGETGRFLPINLPCGESTNSFSFPV